MWQELKFIEKKHEGCKFRTTDRRNTFEVLLVGKETFTYRELFSTQTMTASIDFVMGGIQAWEIFVPLWVKQTNRNSCQQHTPISFGSRRGYCSTCDVDLQADEQGHWKVAR